MEQRLSRHLYYLEMAKAASMRSTCINKRWGAIIVKDDAILSTGYNGAPRGRKNCSDLGRCYRLEARVPRGTRYELCRSVHAEANAIINASRHDMVHSTMYLYGWDVVYNDMVKNPNSCMMCKRMIINAGITSVIVADRNGVGVDSAVGYGYRVYKVADWVKEEDVQWPDVSNTNVNTGTGY